MPVPKTVALITHEHPPAAAPGVEAAISAAAEAGCELIASAAEHAKLGALGGRVREADPREAGADLCVVLGGDGSILYGLRELGTAGIPVLGVNFGTMGFLAAVGRDNVREGLAEAFAGRIVSLELPALRVDADGLREKGFNDVCFSRMPHGRIAELSYRIAGEEVGHVRCDGLVAATPAGSTGYNLANGGPILAWGVSGYAVSYVAPHTLDARPLVVGPEDALHVGNAAGREPVEIVVDGVREGVLEPGAEAEVVLEPKAARLVQLPGTSFYTRIRERFGHLAH